MSFACSLFMRRGKPTTSHIRLLLNHDYDKVTVIVRDYEPRNT